jgi:hypothetical protein
VDTHLQSIQLRVERKQITFDLRENPQGMFLRITEQVGCGHRNSIIIPVTGLESFRDSVNEVVAFSKTLDGSGTVLPLGQLKAETPAPDGSTGLTIGS